jgi:hypothetical protein
MFAQIQGKKYMAKFVNFKYGMGGEGGGVTGTLNNVEKMQYQYTQASLSI